MLDVAYIRDNLDAVKQNCVNRLAAHAEVDKVVQLDDQRRTLVSRQQELQAEANRVAKAVGPEKDPTKKQELIARGKQLRAEVAQLDAQVTQVEKDRDAALMTIPNLTHPDSPVGHTAADNKVIKRWGEPKQFSFPKKDHVTLAESLDLVDFEAGQTVTGSKFYFLKNEGALLELALVNYAMQTLVKRGYTPVITPDLARVEVLEGIGFMPRDPNPETRQVYAIADTDMCLIATAEITLGGMLRDRLLEKAKLPLKYVGLSHCFRTEAGAAGRDTKGLYRVHQFTKVEMFAFCTPEDSEAIHKEILDIEESIFQGLGLAYHVIDTCTGDLGGPAYRKYDIEAWMPCRGEIDPATKLPKGDYGEVTSTSNCSDFQARRLGVRYKAAGQQGGHFVHTLNGTAVAVTRAIVAILENYQQEDGTVVIPEVLRPWMGKDLIAKKG